MDIVEWLRGHSPTLRIAMRLDEAADEIERLREYIQNWKDTDSAAIMALKQAQEEIERLRAENSVLLKGFENQQSKAKAALMKLEKGLNLL